MKPETLQKYEEGEKLYNEGMSLRQIGKQLKFDAKRFAEWLDEKGIRTIKRNKTERKTHEYICECGKKFKRYPSQLKNEKPYCSTDCKHRYRENSFSVEQFRIDRDAYEFVKPLPTLGRYDLLGIAERSRTYLNKDKYDHYFFQNGIKDELTAYVYGLLITDGNVYNNEVSLALMDHDIVRKVANVLKYRKEPYIKENRHLRVVGRLLGIRIASDYMVNDLIALGCPPKKSEIVSYPEIPDDLDAHLIRGIVDGDGSWSTRQRDDTCDLKFFGNDRLLYGVYLKIKKHLDIEPSYLEYPIDRDSNYKMKSYAVMRYSTKKSKIIRDFLYENATIFGDRKKETAYLR